MGSTVRLAYGAAGRASARVLTVLLLLAAVGMLSLPSTAHAVVGKKHARAYRVVVSSMLKAKNIDVQSYNALDDAVVDTAQNIIEIYQGDPVDHDALLNEEAHAAELLADANGLIAEPEALQRNADYLWGLCKNWFSSRADRITLKQGLHNIDAAAEQVITAYGEMGSACDALATDPPDVGKAREHNANAIAAVNLANSRFTKAFKQLHSLQR
ncbi:MAG: hypothetical protein WCN81_07400 [Actinomycetes bacterium]